MFQQHFNQGIFQTLFVWDASYLYTCICEIFLRLSIYIFEPVTTALHHSASNITGLFSHFSISFFGRSKEIKFLFVNFTFLVSDFDHFDCKSFLNPTYD